MCHARVTIRCLSSKTKVCNLSSKMLGEENVGRFYVSMNDRMIYKENAVYNNYKILLTIIYVLGDKQVSNFPCLK